MSVNKSMIFKPVNSRYAICDIFPAFYASGQTLSLVTQFKYLGHVIRNDLCDDELSKEKLRLYSQGAMYFLVDLRDVRVLSRYDYFRRTACVLLFSIVDYIYISDSTTVYIVF